MIEYLKNEGLFEAESILERERMNRKKRSRLANQVVDKMEESGEIKKLWRDFHINLKAARDRQSSGGCLYPSYLNSTSTNEAQRDARER